MLRNYVDGLGGQEEADGDVGECGELEVGGIADDQGSGWNGDGGTTAKGESAGRCGVDLAVSGGEGDVRRADGERVGAELIAEDDADDGAGSAVLFGQLSYGCEVWKGR